MLKNLEKLLNGIQQEPWAKALPVDKESWTVIMEWIDKNVLSVFLNQVVQQIDEIVDIDPVFSEPQIFENATRYMVNFLGAHSASVRIYDPRTKQMLSYGSYPSREDTRETNIPLDGSIAGEVVKTHSTLLVPNIFKEELYQNKRFVYRKGISSLMAIPLDIPRFFPRERDTAGVIQIYYTEKGREFTPLEVQMASVMAKRLSFVIARKKILSLHKSNEKKDAIVRHIFRALAAPGGIKMKDIFNRVVPELADITKIQSSALFSITEDLNDVIIEAGYPERGSYHSIGRSFTVSSEPVFELLLNLRDYSGDSAFEIVTMSYVLVVDPQQSDLISDNLKRLAATQNINSILYVPLKVDGEINHFMTFDALDQRKRYTNDEIDVFLFMGRELVKAQKMERLGDTLHDFKNPAIATAGFARRLKTLLEQEESETSKEQVRKYVDIIFQETSRLQELGLSIYRVGKEQVINMTDTLLRRFEINKEAIKEQLKQNVVLKEGPFDPEVKVRCYPIHLERIFDNLLNNATKAIPLKGGELRIGTYTDGEWACSEISNTGRISEDDLARIIEGEGQGRGLYITNRIIHLLKGRIDVKEEEGRITFIVRLPVYKG